MTADNPRMRVLLVWIVMAALAVPARAGGIVLESYTGDRPPDAPRLVNPVLGELVSRGYNVGDTLARAYEGKVSIVAISSFGLPADFAAQIDAGFKEWVSGRFDDAEKHLGALVELAHANSGAFARDQSLREPLLKGLIALALSQQRSGDPSAAHATFAEILRAYPDATVSRATYGAEAYDGFEQIRKELAAAGTGKLTIKLADDTGVVFIDEQYRAVGSTTVDLPPGEYRVCVLLDKQPSRTHRIVVHAKDETKLAIDPRLDRAVRTGPWTGLQFATAGDRESHEGAFAAGFANSLGAASVVVVGIDQVRGRPAIVGSLVSLTGRELRRASVAIDPDPSLDRLRALARYLAGEEPAGGIDVQEPSSAPVASDKPEATGRETDEPATGGRWGGWKWLTGGLGVGALGAGVTLAVLDGRCKDDVMPGRVCNNVYATEPVGYIAIAAGAALLGASIYFFATGGAREPSRTAYIVPAPGGGVVGLAGRF